MSDLLYEVHERIALITLNRPGAHNALSIETVELLAEASRAIQEDDRVLAAVITGAGDEAFCAGGDLAELLPALTDGHLEILVPEPTQRFFSNVYKPIIAAVNGLCIAGGFEILLGTDLRVASETASFGLAEVRWGLVPGAGAHVRLPAQVPWPIAMQLLLTGETIDAQRAYEVGLVNEIRPQAEALPRAIELAERIAVNGPLAVQTAKEIAQRALGHERGFALEWGLQHRVLNSQDAQEGPRAFIAGRRPQFEGR
ncbi:MAG TPA: enoyl-CoA hydratase-related protein [Solirubrobacteraceae bacterium]|jgi:enoyl-CoA hydratase